MPEPDGDLPKVFDRLEVYRERGWVG